uniref:mechanosensitive ion channel protein 10-like n=1 Tax=Erigeron canadensis TaxID=72917 RepID=UPI001CB8A59F|nr:mechanosensitive ion channel protein 10-like [Erigeron canadensis]
MKLDSDPKNEVKVDISGPDQDSGLRSSSEKVAAAAKTANSPSELMLETPTAASPSATLRTPLLASPADANDENGRDPKQKRPAKKITLFTIMVIVCCCLVMVIFIISATMNKLDYKVENVEIWKWCCLGLPVFLGLVFPNWLMNIILEKLPLHGKINDDKIRVPFLKLVRSVVNSYKVLIWLSLTAIIWWYLIGPSETEPNDATKTLRLILKAIISAIYVAFAWVLRSVALKFLYDFLYIKRFLKRIQENRFHQYILETLSGRELSSEVVVHSSSFVSSSVSNVVQTPQQIKCRMIETAWQIGFYTLPSTLDQSKDLMNLDEQNNRIITTERKAKAAGDLIFRNVAKPGNRYVEEEDLLRFMKKEELDVVLPLIGGKDESGRIDEKPFLNWVVSMYTKIEFQEHSLDDMLEAMETLIIFVNVLLVAVLIILWVILMDITTTEVLLFMSSQFLLAIFTFGNSAKSTFEAMIFVFLKHPFDIGDRCVIDGVQVVVEKVSILTTAVFRIYDNEKIYYPNSILATKCISNLDRSSEMKDIVKFDLDVPASDEKVSAIKAKIKMYINSNAHLWQPNHSVRVTESEGVTESEDVKVKMRLYVTHTTNFLDYEEISDKRSNLVQELTNIFHHLGIKYHIYPPTTSD